MRLLHTSYGFALLFVVLLTLVSGRVFGQRDGSLDTTFHINIVGCSSVAEQPDGKLIFSGWFTDSLRSDPYPVARVHANGSLDTSFNSAANSWYDGRSVLLQSNGKIIVGGGRMSFTNSPDELSIIRLNPTGSVDSSFQTVSGAYFWGMILQADDKILALGSYDPQSGTNPTGHNITRFYSDGGWDSSFSPDTTIDKGFTGPILLQPDGKLLVGGTFDRNTGTSFARIARLNADGGIDSSFFSSNNFYVPDGFPCVSSLALQPDGKILVGGSFDYYYINPDPSQPGSSIKRINPDGSLDSSFLVGRVDNGTIYTITLQADGKIIIAGNFNSINGSWRNDIARLNTDETVDLSFDAGVTISSLCNVWALRPDGKILVDALGQGVLQLNNGIVTEIPKPHEVITLSPNPGHPGQTLHLSEAGNTLRLTDMQGRLMSTLSEQEPGGYTLPTVLAPGYYLLTSGRGKRYRLCVAPQ